MSKILYDQLQICLSKPGVRAENMNFTNHINAEKRIQRGTLKIENLGFVGRS